MRIRSFLLLIGLVSVAWAARAAVPFQRVSTSLPGVSNGSLAWGDYDNDGCLDVLLTGSKNNGVITRVYHNNGDGSFTPTDTVWPEVPESSADWLDFDQDGSLDVLFSGWRNGEGWFTTVYRGDGHGSFTDLGWSLPGEYAIWGDFDNDGDPDLAMIGVYGTQGACLYWNVGLGVPMDSGLVLGKLLDRIIPGDFDGDGDLDLYCSPLAMYGEGPKLFRNDGPAGWTDLGARLPPQINARPAWVDAHGDGTLDLLYCGFGADGTLAPKVLRSLGGGRFADLAPELTPLGGGAAVWGDWDLDGASDALMVGAHAGPNGQQLELYSRLFSNDGTGQFRGEPVLFPVFSGGRAAWGDYDRDGDLDLLLAGSDVTGSGLPATRLYRNDGASARPLPEAPTGLAVSTAGNRVLFQWSPPSQAQGLTYNLRVGTRPGGGDVLSALSTADGWRRVARMGNAQYNTRWRLRTLPLGTYYWSVQAIDAAFRGSPFATEASFTVSGQNTNAPPTLAEIPNQFTFEDTPLRAVEFTVGDAETPAEQLEVTVAAADPALVPAESIVLGGGGAHRTLAILPATNRFGDCLMTTTVTDAEGQTTSRRWMLSVLSVNDPPEIEPVPNQTTYVGVPVLEVPLVVRAVETNAPTISAWSSNTNLVRDTGLRIGRVGSSTTLNIYTVTNQVGSTTITLQVDDGESQAMTSFVLTVRPRAFTPLAISLPAATYRCLEWVDYNLDGRLDILANGVIGSTLFTRLYRCDGGTNYRDSGLALPPLSVPAFAWGDYDNDGDLDLAVCGLLAGTPTTRIYRWDGAAGFTPLDSALVGVRNGAVAWGDYDNDGDLDLAVSGISASGSRTVVYRNDAGVFRDSGLRLPDGAAGGVAWGDYDGDARLDLLVTQNSQPALLFHNDGGGRLTDSGLTLPAVSGRAAWMDLDNDGRLDFGLLGSQGTDLGLWLGQNAGAQGFVLRQFLAETLMTAWGDYDNDGRLDCFRLGRVSLSRLAYRYVTEVLRNAGDWRFAETGPLLGDVLLTNLGQAAWGDFDNDGDQDLLVADTRLGVTLYRNDQGMINYPPSAPTGLSAMVEGTTVRLSWDPATDGNQTGGLSYNVRVGRTPGGCEVVSPMSGPGGNRRVLALGNAQLNTFLGLTNLEGETFYWTVQAVDAAFAGGPFAPEQRFVAPHAGNQPPSLTVAPEITTPEDTPVSLEFQLVDDLTPPGELRVFALSGDPLLVPNAHLGLSGAGAHRTLTLRPATNQTGSAIITLIVIDAPGLSSTHPFRLTVTPVNDPPTISAIPDQTVCAGVPTPPLRFEVRDVETPPEQLWLTARSSDTSLVAEAGLVLGGVGTKRTLTVTPAAGQLGQVIIEVVVSDAEGASATNQFRLATQPQHFTPLEAPLPRMRGGAAAWGDYDNDGDLDLVLAGDSGASRTVLLRNDGQGVFRDSGVQLLDLRGGSAAWGDYDQDGDLDLVLSGLSDSQGAYSTRLYRNDGGGRFTESGVHLPNVAGAATWADVDNDGRLDLVLTGDTGTSGYFGIFHNLGHGQFQAIETGIPRLYGYTASLGDYDGDGYLDLALTGNINGLTSTFLYRNQGYGRFLDAGLTWPNGDNARMAWGDIDNDGWPDLVVTRYNPQHSTQVYRNDHAGSFVPWGTALPMWGLVAVGDFDNDGWADLLVGGYENVLNRRVALYRQTGDGQWTSVETSLPVVDTGGVSWGDLDNDGDLDVVLLGQMDTDYVANLYRNDILTTNPPPSAPDSLSVFASGFTARLSWAPATDPNQTNGLTYNVRLGTTPGGCDVVSPMSSPAGYRLLPQAGNAGTRTQFFLQGLRPGRTYYGSVQAIDHSFQGSSFAAELAFTVNHLPTLSSITNQMMLEDAPALVLPLLVGDVETSPAELVMTATSSNSALVPPANVVFQGAGPDRTVTITPLPNRSGLVTLTLIVTDGYGDSARTAFDLLVLPVNDPPVVSDLVLTTAEDQELALRLEAADADGDTLTYEVVRPPLNGVLIGSPPNLVYRSLTNYFGWDDFQFRVSDGAVWSRVATVTIQVTPVPDVLQPRLVFERVLGEGMGRVVFEGEPRQLLVLEATADLTTWTPLLWIQTSDGKLAFIDPEAARLRCRFYRVRPVQLPGGP